MSLTRAWLARAACALLFPAAILAQPPARAETTSVATDQASTRLIFDRALLAGYGLSVDPDVEVLDLVATMPSSFVVDAADADFEGITSGSLRHSGRFTLRRRGTAVALEGLEIVPGATPLTIDLLDARGRRLLHGDQMHFSYDPASGRLRLENVDISVTPILAAALGAPDLAGIAIARLELEATTRAFRAPAPEGCASCSNPVWDGVVDVKLKQIGPPGQTPGVQQIERSGQKVTIRVSTELESGGTADVPWYRKFTGSFPPYGNDQHPFLVWAIYRIVPLSGGAGAPTAVEMMGQSALKHAFLTTNQGCCCASGQILWAPIGGPTHDTVACTDVYGHGNNNDPNALGPRDELEAHTGIWQSTGSFFDQDSDGVCDWDTAGSAGGDCGSLTFSDPFDRRLAVEETDLSTAGATYFADAWYIVREDINIFNTMGWLQIDPLFSNPNWTFPALTTFVQGSVLDAWVPFGAAPAGSSHERVDSGVGHLSLAAKTTDLTGGQFHYEYALANHDFDRKVQSFRVPFPAGTVITNAAFRGLGNGVGADWEYVIEPDAITFQAQTDPNVDALDWGTLFSFGFDADAAPAAGSTDLGALEESPALLFAAPAVTPGGALGSAIFFDDLESGATGRWSSSEG